MEEKAPLQGQIAVIALAAAKETSWELPMGVERFKLQARTAVAFKASYERGEVKDGNNYWTVKSGAVYETDGPTQPATIYLCAASAIVVEAWIWRRTI